jgi:hypothetical protein
VLFAKLQSLARMRPPANASFCALAWKLAKAELPRVSPNHSQVCLAEDNLRR